MDDFEAECFKIAELVKNLAERTSDENVLHLLNDAGQGVLAAASWNHSLQPRRPTSYQSNSSSG